MFRTHSKADKQPVESTTLSHNKKDNKETINEIITYCL